MQPTSIISKLTIAAFCIAAFSMCARADLQWRERSITHRATPEETEFIAEYHFVNAGTEAITISRAKASCGCTVVNFETRTYEPGEEGTISATFTYGLRVGVQKKSITVNTSDEKEPVITLALEVEIPELVRLTPQFVMWNGEDRSTRTVTVSILADNPMTVANIQGSNSKFEISVTTATFGRKYVISITPKSSTPSGSRSTITFDTVELVPLPTVRESVAETTDVQLTENPKTPAPKSLAQSFWVYVAPDRTAQAQGESQFAGRYEYIRSAVAKQREREIRESNRAENEKSGKEKE